MKIVLDNLCKTFTDKYVLKDVSYTFEQGGKYAVLGPNGTGKSTLLGVISGIVFPTAGSIAYYDEGTEAIKEKVYKQMSFSAPYMELVGEFTLLELIEFHFKLKEPLIDMSSKEMADNMLFRKSDRSTMFKHFSSGMRQRLKLGLSLYSKSKVLLLDEPLTNLDATGKAWYYSMIGEHLEGRTLIIASNDPAEYEMCEEQLLLTPHF
jgi:ABC-type multidrug transport system ATPase subunit